METFFPLASYWWFYAAFGAFVLAMLALDLGVFHRKAHEVSFREAAGWSAVWIALALAFNAGFWWYASATFGEVEGRRLGLEFLAAYLIEKALSVDNLFVFAMVFSYFAVPARYQHRVLFFGILGALVLRAVFIAAGSALVQVHWVVVGFGVFLAVTGVKMALVPDRGIEPEKNLVIRAIRRLMPISPGFEEDRFVVVRNGVRTGTPLLVALAFVEFSDVVFALDSVPAVFAVSSEPLIVFTSNVFAILGLRSLYFLLAGSMHRFTYLRYGLAAVLVFVGLKMAWLNEAFGGKFPIGVSLGVIAGLVGASILASLLLAPRRRMA
ncbi:MAG: TerC family protein [Deltaproteobacteria bacterium]|nr:TerC family protein [Deltaproteobacteria bacterium]